MTGAGADAGRATRRDQTELIVIEATGGYELLSVDRLAAVSLPMVVGNPRQARDFAKATGQVAKTDRIGADIPLCQC